MITTKSPTRVDLAGGTLDCWPLYLFVGDCVTVNLSIDIFTGCELTELQTQNVDIEVTDLKYKSSFKNIDHFFKSSDRELLLLQKIIEYFHPKNGFRLRTYSQSPMGGGLGGSSSLCISLIRAFNQLQGVRLTTQEMVTLASNLEAKVILSPTGTQDYFPAIEPGLNIIHYTANGPKLEPCRRDLSDIARSMFLVYTGKSHHSGINNWQVIKSLIDGDVEVLSALKKIAHIANDTAEVVRNGKWQELPALFRSEFDSRVKLAKAFSSPEIDDLKKTVLDLGAEAVKICGAGGGGCVIVWAESKYHERMFEACLKKGYQPIKMNPVIG